MPYVKIQRPSHSSQYGPLQPGAVIEVDDATHDHWTASGLAEHATKAAAQTAAEPTPDSEPAAPKQPEGHYDDMISRADVEGQPSPQTPVQRQTKRPSRSKKG